MTKDKPTTELASGVSNDSGLDPAQTIAALHDKGVAIDYGPEFRMMVMRDDLARAKGYCDRLTFDEARSTMTHCEFSLNFLVPRVLRSDPSLTRAQHDSIYKDLMLWDCLKKKLAV